VRRSAVIPAAIGIARPRVRAANGATQTVTGAEPRVRSSTCASRLYAVLHTEAAIRAGGTARRATADREAFPITVDHGRAMADHIPRLATEVVDAHRVAVGAVTSVAVEEAAIRAAEVVDTRVAVVIPEAVGTADIAKLKLM
jgi:hypothetical protein